MYYYGAEKIIVNFCKSQDSIDITYYSKKGVSKKINKKLSDLKDVFATEHWVKGKKRSRLVGHKVHLNWK